MSAVSGNQHPVPTQAVGVFITVALFPVVVAGPAFSAGFEILKPHRAIYDVELADSSDRSGIKSMNGRIVYEMEGNECDGISVRYRFVSRVNANGDIFTTDQQTASHEAPDGNQYSFVTKSFVNERLDRTVKGVANSNSSGITVELDEPRERSVDLPEAKFISTHLVEVIERARDGQAFFKTEVFDGGDDADEILKTTNIIGKAAQFDEVLKGEKASAIEKLEGEEAWPVTIAYFDNEITTSSEPLPVYQVSFLLYEGGISRRLKMTYPDYAITGSLVALEYLDRETCKLEN